VRCSKQIRITILQEVQIKLHFFFFSLALQPQFGPWPTSMKLSVSLRFSRSWTVGRTPWASDQLVARPLPVHKHRKTHTHTQTLNIHALGGIRKHDPGFRASEDSACLRPLGYRDRPNFTYFLENKPLITESGIRTRNFNVSATRPLAGR
jgi:hypothetical protein